MATPFTKFANCTITISVVTGYQTDPNGFNDVPVVEEHSFKAIIESSNNPGDDSLFGRILRTAGTDIQQAGYVGRLISPSKLPDNVHTPIESRIVFNDGTTGKFTFDTEIPSPYFNETKLLGQLIYGEIQFDQ